MTRPIRIGVLLQPGNAPDFATWRGAVLHAEELGADLIFGWDHFHRPQIDDVNHGIPVLAEVQPDVTNFEGWTALASWGEISHRAEIELLVTGIGYRNPTCSPTWPAPSTTSAAAVSCSASAQAGTKRTTPPTDTTSAAGKSRFDLFDAGPQRIEARLGQLIPPPVRKIPVLIGGTGPKRTLPAVARYADIWHTFLSVEAFTEASARVDELTLAAGRSGNDIERSVHLVRHAQRGGLPRGRRHHVHHRDRPRRHHRLRLQHPGGMLAWRDRQQ